MPLHSLQIEKHVLGGLIQNQDVIAEVEGFVNERDFVAQPHSTIFSCLTSSYLQKERIDKVLLSQKIKNLGISFKDNINIFDYIDSISFAPITKDATMQACKELVKYRILRDLDFTLSEMKEKVSKATNDDLTSTISTIDAIYGQRMNTFEGDDEPRPLFEGFYDEVEERGNNPVEETGISTPYPEFNRLYGGFRRKNLYIFAARAKAGKSTLLAEMGCEISRIHGVPVLILDTEMSGEEVSFRSGAAKSEVPLWHLKTGNWRKNNEYVKKVREGTLKGLDNKYSKVYHLSVGNKSKEEVASICRRWYLRVVGRGNDCLFIYDYLKIVGNDENNRKEYQEMGDKVDFFKKLAEELDSPFATACQNNREGVVGGREASEIIDDERSIGLSDRITMFASGVWIFRRRTPEEVLVDTPGSGTHKLIEVVCREQGRDAAGHQDSIRRTFPDGKTKYVKNFINFDIHNFKVEERGSLIDTIKRQNSQFLVRDPNSQNEETL
jgi:replicative DNA helicase